MVKECQKLYWVQACEGEEVYTMLSMADGSIEMHLFINVGHHHSKEKSVGRKGCEVKASLHISSLKLTSLIYYWSRTIYLRLIIQSWNGKSNVSGANRKSMGRNIPLPLAMGSQYHILKAHIQ